VIVQLLFPLRGRHVFRGAGMLLSVFLHNRKLCTRRKRMPRETLALFPSRVPPFENELVFTTRMRDTAFKRSLKRVPLATEVQIRISRRLLHPTQKSRQAGCVPSGRNRNHTFSQHRAASASRPPPAQGVSFLFQSTARRRTFPGHSAEPGEDESQLPLDL
jgi:hypothetical protein